MGAGGDGGARQSNCEGEDGVRRNGRAVDWDNPLLGHGRQSPCLCLGPDPRITSGPAVMVPRKQAGHMTCTRPQAERQILLATRASSTHDSKRASQEARHIADVQKKV